MAPWRFIPFVLFLGVSCGDDVGGWFGEPPGVEFSPKGLSFEGEEGGADPAAQTVRIEVVAFDEGAWTASTTETWLSVLPASGKGDSTLQVSVSIAGLAQGDYQAQLIIDCPGTGLGPFALGVTLVVGPYGGPVWHVDADATAGADTGGSWANAFLEVQDAMAAASAGHEIWVAEGTYGRQGSDTVLLTMKDGVSIYGGFAGTETSRDERDAAAHVTTLDGEDVVYHVVVGASDATFDGFVVTRGNASGAAPDLSAYGGGMYNNMSTSGLAVRNCVFLSNATTGWGGGMHNWQASLTIVNCVFRGNSADMGGAIFNDYSAPKLRNCTFVGNSAVTVAGAMHNYSESPTLTNCILWGDSAPLLPEIYNDGGSSCEVTYSCVQGGYSGTGNIDADPLFVGAGDLHLQPGSPCIDTGTILGAPSADLDGNIRPQGGGVDMGAYERAANNIWHVDDSVAASGDGTSWATAFKTVQEGNTAASAGDEVWVAQGTYTNNGGGTATVLVMKAGVGYFGGFAGNETVRTDRDPAAHETILNGEDTAYHVVEGANEATLHGFTITRGNARDGNPNQWGGGMLNYIDRSPTVIRCCFLGNTGVIGGALYNHTNCSPVVVHCVFSGNSAGTHGGAMRNVAASSPTVVNCTFTGNTAVNEGGAMGNEGSGTDPVVANCIVWGNAAAGGPEIYNVLSATCTVAYSDVGQASGFTDAGGNINADPLFVDAANGDLRLSAGSPCIDAADGDAAPATDILGNARWDDPGTPDTGTGTPDYADMGAYEFLGSITVTSPNGGELLKRGDAWTVTWDPAGSGGNVRIEIGHVGTDPVAMPEGAWTGTTNTSGALCAAARCEHTAVWTGTRMIVWGGSDPARVKSGAVYDPATDTWESSTAENGLCPSERLFHSAVWAGSRMIVWGGAGPGGIDTNTGAIYNDARDTWELATSTDPLVPFARCKHTAVWTGPRMIVWGGQPDTNTGALYDPTTNTWESETATGGLCPTARKVLTSVWTGSRMVVWGGEPTTDTGAIYDPATNTWESETSLGLGVPSARYCHSAVWTGSRMIVWGGTGPLSTGAIYDPATDAWEADTADPTGTLTARTQHAAVWTGTRMLVWGGHDGALSAAGAFYNPPGWHVQAVVTDSTPDDGTFVIPASVTANLSVGDEYRVRVTHVPSGACDDSDNDFTIANLDIWRPKAGDVWAAEIEHDIKWQETWCADTLTLEYSTDGSGGPWTTIATGVAASDGKYPWTPPAGAISKTVCVRITSEQNPTISTVSDGFEVAYAYKVVDLTTGAVADAASISDLLTNDDYKTSKLVLKLIEPGSFHMGDESDPPVGAADELPVHFVRITQPYYVGVFEVTQRQWSEVEGTWPSSFTTDPDKRPVETVSWDDCQAFLAQLSAETGETFRLPTEAEWEYACKAGTSTNFSYGAMADGAYMWYSVNSDTGSGQETHEVGTKLPNPWGLYDVHGNIYEWCEDWYDSGYYSVSPADDPQGPAGGTYRVARGGCLDSPANNCRSAHRNWTTPDSRDGRYGFRAVLAPGEP